MMYLQAPNMLEGDGELIRSADKTGQIAYALENINNTQKDSDKVEKQMESNRMTFRRMQNYTQ